MHNIEAYEFNHLPTPTTELTAGQILVQRFRAVLQQWSGGRSRQRHVTSEL